MMNKKQLSAPGTTISNIRLCSFDLSNASASFQGYIIKILAKKLDIFIIVYLDDIFIYIEDLGQGHLEAV